MVLKFSCYIAEFIHDVVDLYLMVDLANVSIIHIAVNGYFEVDIVNAVGFTLRKSCQAAGMLYP